MPPNASLATRALTTFGGLALAGWTVFVHGAYWRLPTNRWYDVLVAWSPALLLIGLYAAWETRPRWLPRLNQALDRHGRALEAVPRHWLGPAIALTAGAGLFAELMMIRVHASWFQLFGYFKNVSLLSCFLGLGIGYLLGGRRVGTPVALVLLALQNLLLYGMRWLPPAAELQNPIAEQLAFGMGQASALRHVVVVYGFLVAVFALNALCFVPLGQVVARLMSRMEKLPAYGWNLAGSLGGIALLAGLSWLWTPPAVWMAVTLLLLLPVVRPWRLAWPGAILGVATIVVLSAPHPDGDYDIFSPYQILTVHEQPPAPPEIRVNNVYYQRILDFDAPSNDTASARIHHYDLPYAFGPSNPAVLILGAGTGNDVASAVRSGARAVAAVEIDPAILQLGRRFHPSQPYQAEHVTAVVADARNHVRHTDDRYDLIVYGLLDSHTLLSGLGGVRLDSYVYTVEALREARAHLTDDGAIVLTFSLIRPALGRKLYLMLEEAFDGRPPLVFRTGYDGGYTFVGGDSLDPATTLPADLVNVTAQFADPSLAADVSTDDWPFFYMPERTYPLTYLVMIVLLLGVSVVAVVRLVPDAGTRWSAPCFFLGAGFMLVETKGITELALVYGSTWFVVSAVIAGILIMAFAANLAVLRWGAPRPTATYGLLLATLAAGMLAPREALGAVPLTLLLTLPLFFSGFAFSTELARARSVGIALASNLLGAMLGGFLEYNAMYFGFRSLYWLAGLMYVLAFLTSRRGRAAPGHLAPDRSGW